MKLKIVRSAAFVVGPWSALKILFHLWTIEAIGMVRRGGLVIAGMIVRFRPMWAWHLLRIVSRPNAVPSALEIHRIITGGEK